MAVSQKGLMCKYCGTKTMHEKTTCNHLVHAVVSLFLCGLWLPIWILAAINSNSKPYICSRCGTGKKVFW